VLLKNDGNLLPLDLSKLQRDTQAKAAGWAAVEAGDGRKGADTPAPLC
jgi:hypothetical protein